MNDIQNQSTGIGAEGVNVLKQYLAAHRAMLQARQDHALYCTESEKERAMIMGSYLDAENVLTSLESLLDELSI